MAPFARNRLKLLEGKSAAEPEQRQADDKRKMVEAKQAKQEEEQRAQKLAAMTPPPKPDIELVPVEAAYVTIQNANVRAEPSASAAKVSTLPRGTEVYVPAKTTGGDWFKVERDGKSLGYVYIGVLKEKAGAEKTKRAEDKRERLEEERRKQRLATAAPPPKPAGAAEPKPAVGLRFAPGDSFRDCGKCPELVVIPPGNFMMGSTAQERRWAIEAGSKIKGLKDEQPQHRVRIGYKFAVGKYELTQVEWHSVMGTNLSRFKDDRNPVEHVSWKDAQEFVKRLSRKTGHTYRLLTEAEWEYAARAGTTGMSRSMLKS